MTGKTDCDRRAIAGLFNRRGDVCFKVHREGHHLDRCRTPFTLARERMQRMDEMNGLVPRVREEG